MRHQDLTINHILESWVFANATARLAAGAYIAGDVGRIGYQTDAKTYWRLLSTTPTWALISGSFASMQTAVLAAPPGTTVVSPGVMVGLGALITPTATGKVKATIAGSIVNAIAAKVGTIQMKWGTSTPPVNGVAATGTSVGAPQSSQVSTPGESCPFSVNSIVTGLTPGTAYWFDLAQLVASGGNIALINIAGTLIEIP